MEWERDGWYCIRRFSLVSMVGYFDCGAMRFVRSFTLSHFHLLSTVCSRLVVAGWYGSVEIGVGAQQM